MSLNAPNDIKTVLKTAERYGAKLPQRVHETTTHALTLQGALAAPTAADVTKTLLEHLGDPTAFDKALEDALTRLVQAEALMKLRGQILDRAYNKARQIIANDREAVVSAFGKALAPQLEILTANAALLEPTFNPRNLDALTPEQFTAWKRCEPATADVETVAAAIRWLYPINPDHVLNHNVTSRLPFVEPPSDLPTVKAANDFIGSIDGVRRFGGMFATPGGDRNAFWPSRVLHGGGSFVLAGPAATLERAAHLRAACIEPVAA